MLPESRVPGCWFLRGWKMVVACRSKGGFTQQLKVLAQTLASTDCGAASLLGSHLLGRARAVSSIFPTEELGTFLS